MRKFHRILTSAAALAAAAAAPAFGHEGHHGGGFSAGFAHPLTGLDHLAVMLAVGALGARQGGAALVTLAGLFLAFMAAGAALGFGGIALPFVEPMILASVGLMVAALFIARRLAGSAAALACAAFATAHGYAHAVEAPASGSAFSFMAGALLATALLLAAGASAVMAWRARAL